VCLDITKRANLIARKVMIALLAQLISLLISAKLTCYCSSFDCSSVLGIALRTMRIRSETKD
jgi:hypothetical protein